MFPALEPRMFIVTSRTCVSYATQTPHTLKNKYRIQVYHCIDYVCADKCYGRWLRYHCIFPIIDFISFLKHNEKAGLMTVIGTLVNQYKWFCLL